MPLITLASNVPAEEFPIDFNIQFTELMAELLGKPTSRIILLVMPNAQLSHGTTRDPSCLIVIKSIGSFSADKNIKYSASISEFIKKTLGIDPAHCLIHFFNLDPEDVGCNGTTMKELMKK
uniref:Macrophage migration inhibitory factor 2 n=1 Tax=Dirofilaria immitis TaxID=6287 RepID=A0A5Q2UT58_DIRIM|nr:macrophage migration inhibitory factor 2 [Dirofilaria immitis]